jgi:hypothetical protein
VPEPETLNSTTSSTLAQLLEIDTQLSMQQSQLLAQLESIQHKRQSLQVVIALFDETDKTDVATPTEETITTPQAQTQKQPQSVDENLAASPTEQEESPSAVSSPASTTAKKPASSSKKKNPTKKTQPSKAAKQAPSWQQYLGEEFYNSSLPQAISEVLQSQPELVWEISAVVDAIFVEDIPVAVKKKVRLQITNLLAQGARENKWYRGQQGCYTIAGNA